MTLSPFAVVAVLAVVVVLVVVAVVGGLTGNKSLPSPYRSFNFSQDLKTGPVTASNTNGCGPNVAERVMVPPYSTLNYFEAQNDSGVYANIWVIAPGSYGYMNSGSPGTGSDVTGTGAIGVSFTFYFQGCGDLPSFPFGFWGSVARANPVAPPPLLGT